MDATDGELEASLDGAGGGLLLVALLVGHGALGPLAGEALAGKSLSSLARHCRLVGFVRGCCVLRVRVVNLTGLMRCVLKKEREKEKEKTAKKSKIQSSKRL